MVIHTCTFCTADIKAQKMQLVKKFLGVFPHLALLPPPPRAFRGAFEATVLLAPPSPFVRTIAIFLLSVLELS